MELLVPFNNGNKGGPTSPLLSDERALITQDRGGRWMHAAKQGRGFVGTAAATGVILPIFSNTAQVFGIWNPAGSGVNAIIASLRATYVSGTGAAGGYIFGVTKNAGASLATGGISVFTEAAPDPMILGGPTGGNKCRFTGSAATVLAPTIGRSLGISQLVTTAADATNVTFSFEVLFDGDLIVAPNTAIWLAGNIATVCVWAPSIAWVEENV